MAVYKVTTSNKSLDMEDVTTLQKEIRSKKKHNVSVELSRQILDKMKRDAGIRNNVSDNKVLHSWIIKHLSYGTI